MGINLHKSVRFPVLYQTSEHIKPYANLIDDATTEKEHHFQDYKQRTEVAPLSNVYEVCTNILVSASS